jgi:hypothetical protein
MFLIWSLNNSGKSKKPLSESDHLFGSGLRKIYREKKLAESTSQIGLKSYSGHNRTLKEFPTQLSVLYVYCTLYSTGYVR